MLAGKWTYRSFRAEPALVGDDAGRALALILGEGVLDFDAASGAEFRGALGMAGGHALALIAMVDQPEAALPLFSMIGTGIPGTPTEGWRYEYRGSAGYLWPAAVGQPPCLLGTAIRMNSHGRGAPAGETACFMAVRQLAGDKPRSARARPLMAGH